MTWIIFVPKTYDTAWIALSFISIYADLAGLAPIKNIIKCTNHSEDVLNSLFFFLQRGKNAILNLAHRSYHVAKHDTWTWRISMKSYITHDSLFGHCSSCSIVNHQISLGMGPVKEKTNRPLRHGEGEGLLDPMAITGLPWSYTFTCHL